MNFLIRLDIWINVHIFRGKEGETISSRLGRKIEDKDCIWCRIFCRTFLLPLAIIFKQGGKHCRKAIQDRYR
jgi:hypothetical protein